MLLFAVLLLTTPATAGGQLLAPTLIRANGTPINVDIGHSAPWVHDFDRDGKPDLLVGQFSEGKLRIYRNIGTRNKPAFKDFQFFKTGGQIVTVPYG